MPYSTHQKTPSLRKTTGIWCLLWRFSNDRAMPRAGDQNPNVKGEKDEQRCTSFRSAERSGHAALAHFRQLREESLRPGGESGPQTPHTFLQSLSTSIKHEISERILRLQDWERIRQTSAVIKTHVLCIWRGPHTYLTAFSRCASSALSLESPSFCFTLGKPSIKALTYLVSIRMSAFAGFSTALQINSCVTGIDLFMETHRSER